MVSTVQLISATLLRHNQIFVLYFALPVRSPATSRPLDVAAADGVKANIIVRGEYWLLMTAMAVSHVFPMIV